MFKLKAFFNVGELIELIVTKNTKAENFKQLNRNHLLAVYSKSFFSGKHEQEIALLRHAVDLIKTQNPEFVQRALPTLLSAKAVDEVASVLTGVKFTSSLKNNVEFSSTTKS